MALTEIASGARVYVDANIFIYHFAGRSEDCSRFLERVEQADVYGFTGPTSLLEVAHRLMMLEAVERGLSARPGPAARLAREPDVVRQLSKYYFSALSINRMGIEVLPLPPDFLTGSQEFRQAYGLLVNDSLIPLHMRQAGLAILASADEAFDRIAGIRRFEPADIT
jgi:predicted nucleic acid-binding protein